MAFRKSGWSINHVTHARRLNSRRKCISPICDRQHPPAQWTKRDATRRPEPNAGEGARAVRLYHARATHRLGTTRVSFARALRDTSSSLSVEIVSFTIASASSSNRQAHDCYPRAGRAHSKEHFTRPARRAVVWNRAFSKIRALSRAERCFQENTVALCVGGARVQSVLADERLTARDISISSEERDDPLVGSSSCSRCRMEDRPRENARHPSRECTRASRGAWRVATSSLRDAARRRPSDWGQRGGLRSQEYLDGARYGFPPDGERLLI